MHANMVSKINKKITKNGIPKKIIKTFPLTVKNIVQQTCAQKECELHWRTAGAFHAFYFAQ